VLDIPPMYALVEPIIVNPLDDLVLLPKPKPLAHLVLHGEVRALPVELELTAHVVQRWLRELVRKPMYILRRCTKEPLWSMSCIK
jgi:hypothetical protein